MRLVMGEQVGRAAAPEFFKLFSQLASNTELPVLQDIDRGTECFLAGLRIESRRSKLKPILETFLAFAIFGCLLAVNLTTLRLTRYGT